MACLDVVRRVICIASVDVSSSRGAGGELNPCIAWIQGFRRPWSFASLGLGGFIVRGRRCMILVLRVCRSNVLWKDVRIAIIHS